MAGFPAPTLALRAMRRGFVGNVCGRVKRPPLLLSRFLRLVQVDAVVSLLLARQLDRLCPGSILLLDCPVRDVLTPNEFEVSESLLFSFVHGCSWIVPTLARPLLTSNDEVRLLEDYKRLAEVTLGNEMLSSTSLYDRFCQSVKLVRRGMVASSKAIGHPSAIGVILIYGTAWFFIEKMNIGWDGFGQIFSLLIVVFIQASQNRDTAALHAKIDELIISLKEADSSYAGLEKKDEEDIERMDHGAGHQDKPKTS